MATATRRGGGSVLQVYIFKNGEFTGTDVFVEREVIVGRDATVADLLLESTSVSREHALLTINGNTLHIEDLGSTNGILLNEEEVHEADITRFDEVGIGEFALKFKLVRKAHAGKGGDPAVVFLDEDENTASEDSAPRSRPVTDKSSRKRPHKPPRRAGSDPNAAPRRDPTPSSRGLAKNAPPAPRAGPPERSPVEQRRKKPSPPDRSAGALRAEPAAKAVAPAGDVKAAKPAGDRDPSFKFKEHTVLDAGAALRERLDSIGLGVPKAVDQLPPLPYDGDSDDDDDEDANFVPAYSLVERLVEEDRLVAVERNAQAVEVLTLQGEDVVDVALMRPGDTFWIGPQVGFLRRLTARDLKPRVRMLKLRRDGRCEVRFRKGARGTVHRGQETLKLKGAERRNQRGVFAANLKGGEILDLDDAPVNYHVRYIVPPPPVFDEPKLAGVPGPIRPVIRMIAGLKPSPLGARSIGASIGTHMVGLIITALVSVGQAAPAVSTADFVEVALDVEDLNLEEPKPEPEEEPEPEKKSKESEKVPPKMEAAPSKRKPKLGGTSKAAAGVLGLLSKRGSSAAPGPASAVAAVSNLSAARAPGGGGFRVSGLIGKLPTSSLSVGGGGGGPVTKGGLALLRGGAGGAGRLAGGKGTRAVGGLVSRQPKAMKQKGQGSLDRDEIQKVINAGISQIQRCYERELLRTPGLAGKVQVEWTVAMTGSVKSVRQSFASINSTAVVTCIMGKIKTWKFPRPKGGEVIVTYPFIFKPVGF